jgi:hypothetical protein
MYYYASSHLRLMHLIYLISRIDLSWNGYLVDRSTPCRSPKHQIKTLF